MTEGVYSLFEVRPDSSHKLQRRRRARFRVQDAQVSHLEDLDDELSDVPEGPLTPESAAAIRKLSGPHRQLVRWTPEYGDDPHQLPEFTSPKPFVPAESGPVSRPPVFEYHREGMDRPHTVEVRGDGVVLNGSPLSPQEAVKLLDNVRSGVGTLRYKRVGESLAKAGSYVWRIQNEAGEGPYRSEAFEPQDLDGEIGEQKPHPAEEFENWKDIQDQGGLFGFEHPEHAVGWFGHDALHTLKVNGFPLVKVPVERVWRAKSGRQVAFIPSFKKSEGAEKPEEKEAPELPKLDRDVTVPAAGNLEALASKEPQGLPALVEVNDLWRHLQAGWTETDEALRELGEVLRSSGGDPYRVSDDLFLVFYPDSQTLVTGLRELSEPERVLRPAGLEPFTVSVGAGRDQDEAWEQLQTARRLARQEPGHPQTLVRVAPDLVKTE